MKETFPCYAFPGSYLCHREQHSGHGVGGVQFCFFLAVTSLRSMQMCYMCHRTDFFPSEIFIMVYLTLSLDISNSHIIPSLHCVVSEARSLPTIFYWALFCDTSHVCFLLKVSVCHLWAWKSSTYSSPRKKSCCLFSNSFAKPRLAGKQNGYCSA